MPRLREACGGVYPQLQSGKQGMEEGHEDKGKEVLAVSSVSTNPSGQGDGGEDKGQPRIGSRKNRGRGS